MSLQVNSLWIFGILKNIQKEQVLRVVFHKQLHQKSD